MERKLTPFRKRVLTTIVNWTTKKLPIADGARYVAHSCIYRINLGSITVYDHDSNDPLRFELGRIAPLTRSQHDY